MLLLIRLPMCPCVSSSIQQHGWDDHMIKLWLAQFQHWHGFLLCESQTDVGPSCSVMTWTNRKAEYFELLLPWLTPTIFFGVLPLALGILPVAAQTSFSLFPLPRPASLFPDPATYKKSDLWMPIGWVCACAVASPHYGTRPSLG